MYFLGIEHGTRGIRCALIKESPQGDTFVSDPDVYLEIPRTRNRGRIFPSITDEIRKHVSLEKIERVVMTYSMGDNFTSFTRIQDLETRGILERSGAGQVTGLGSAVFDEILESGLDVLMVPGIHSRTPSILPAFRRLASHCSAPDKVGSAYQSSLYLKHLGFQGVNLIMCDSGANTVTLLIRDGLIIGGVDAALGAPGLLQGPIDLENIRRIDHGKISANEAFSGSGLFSEIEKGELDHLDHRHVCMNSIDRGNNIDSVNNIDRGNGIDRENSIDRWKKDPDFRERYHALASAMAMEIMGLTSFMHEPEGIVITGSAHEIEPVSFMEKINELLSPHSVFYLGHCSAAIGCACIARDISAGVKNILGIQVQGE